MLKAGMARADITPPQGLELAGYPHYPRNNTGFHDPLYASCMYIENEETAVAFISLDILFFSKKHVAKVRKKAEELCGIKGKNIMITCTHTHSGPWASGRLDIESLEAGKEQPKEYVETVINCIVEIICDAKKNAFDASFASTVAVCGAESGIGGNRRVYGGYHDPYVTVMAVKDKSDVIRGIFVNYSLHPTFIHEWSTVCTADYVAYLRYELEETEKEAIAAFFQGTSGNQSSRYYRQGESYDEAERVGRTLGKAAYEALKKAEWKDELVIKSESEEMEIELRNFGTQEELELQVEHDEKIYKELYAKYGNSTNREEYYLWQNANLKLLGSEDQLGYVKMMKNGMKIELLDDEVPMEIHAIRLDDLCVIGVPGELFVEYGIYLKAMAGFKKVMVNTVTNGVLPGYFYTPESLVTGGYETDTSMLGVNMGRLVMDKTLDIVEKLK